MKIMHRLFCLFFLIYMPSAKAEYLVYLRQDDRILPVNEQEYEKIYPLLVKYTWPMSIAHADEIDFDVQHGISPANEEAFLKEKLQEINPQLDIAFIPTVLYELFCIAHAHKIEGLNRSSPIISQPFDKNIKEMMADPSQSIKKVLLRYDIVNSKYPEVKEAYEAVNNALAIYLQKLFTDHGIKIKRDINETSISDIIKELCFVIKNKLFESTELNLANPSGTQSHVLKTRLEPLNKKQSDTADAENPGKDFFARIVELEYQARDQFAGILYRALGPVSTYIPKERTTVQIIDSILDQSYAQDEYAKLLKSYESSSTDIISLFKTAKFRTVSYGNSLCAGFYFDQGACVLKYLSDNTIGYALFIDKRRYLKEIAAQMAGKSTNAINEGNIFRISPLNTLASLFARGELFHSRSLLYSTEKHPLSWTTGIALDAKVDKIGFIVKRIDPLPCAAYFSRIVGDPHVCRILKLNSHSTNMQEWGNQFDLSSAKQQKIIEDLYNGQQKYTKVLQSLVLFEKFYRELLEKYPQLEPTEWDPSKEERAQLRKAMKELMQQLKFGEEKKKKDI